MRWIEDFSCIRWLAVASVLVILSLGGQEDGVQSAFAQSAGDSTIDERAAELRAFQARLRSTDYVEQMAAFETGMNSPDITVRQIAMKEAFLADNGDLQTMALRNWLEAHTGMIIQLSMPDRPSEGLKKAHESFLGDSMLLESLSVTDKGELAARSGRSGTNFAGQFVPGGVILIGHGAVGHCELNLSVVDDRLLSGALRCQALEPIPAKVQMQ